MATPKTPIDQLAVFVATAGGVGFIPKAPGTAGAVVGVLIYLAMYASGTERWFPHAILAILFSGTLAAQRVQKFWGHDSQRIVVDEVGGQAIAFMLAGGVRPTSALIITGFVLFRVFDIFKPFPLKRLERLPGGLGVMADDVGAGLYALAVMTYIQRSFDF